MRGRIRPCPLTARVSALADDITVFVFRCLDIKAVKKAVCEYERIAGAKVNFAKNEGLQLGAWRGSDNLPGPFRWSDGPVRVLGVWFFSHRDLVLYFRHQLRIKIRCDRKRLDRITKGG